MQHRAKSDQGETRRSVVILSVSALLMAGAAAALPLLRRAARDPKSGCLAGVLARTTIVLVDHTDAWTAATASLLAADLRRIADSAATEERIAVMPFKGSASVLPAPVFDRCKPPATGNLLVDTPQRLARDHAMQFTAPLLSAFAQVARPASAPRTELVQILAALATKARLDAPASAIVLHVYSDMEENSAAFSFTRKPAQSPDAFAAHFAAQISNRLRDIALHIHLLPPVNSTVRPDPRIERAWRAAFARHDIRFTWEKL